jgi:hypothetical protein
MQAQLQQLEKQYAELPKSPRRHASQAQVSWLAGGISMRNCSLTPPGPA